MIKATEENQFSVLENQVETVQNLKKKKETFIKGKYKLSICKFIKWSKNK